MKRSHRRPPVTFEQVNLMAAMLDLMPGEDDTITEEQATALAHKQYLGRLVSKRILDRLVKKGPYGSGIKQVFYRFTDDGRTVARAMKILAEKQKEQV